jgi:apolipoprotein N-acyltransferase
VNAAWEPGFAWRHAYRPLIPFAVALLAVVGFGFARLSVTMPTSPTVVAATITLDQAVADRANRGIDWATFNQSTEAQRASARPQLQATVDQMFARTETALRSGAKLVSWQEGAGAVLEEDKPRTLDRALALARQYDPYLEISLGVLTRTPSWPFIRNQAILIDPTGTVVWTYDKTHPVFGVDSLTTIAGPGVVPVADTPFGRLSTVICNDVGYPELVRQAGQNHADILFAPTHDLIPYAEEDVAEARFRAIENGFSLVRPTTNGPSLITDPAGRIVASQDYFTTDSGIMLGRVPSHGVTTVYSRIGDVVAYLCALGLISLAGRAVLSQRQPSAVGRHQVA